MAFSLSAQTCLSASVRLRLKRFSAVLALRRASRHSASNHGVAGLGLRHTVTTGQCWSSSCVITSRYSTARSSADLSLSCSMFEHSCEAARSHANASRSYLFQARQCNRATQILTHVTSFCF